MRREQHIDSRTDMKKSNRGFFFVMFPTRLKIPRFVHTAFLCGPLGRVVWVQTVLHPWSARDLSPDKVKGILSSPKKIYTGFEANGFVSRAQTGRGPTSTTNHHIDWRLRTSEFIPSLPLYAFKAYLLTHSLTHSLKGSESFLRS
jgi:hypothetical protein